MFERIRESWELFTDSVFILPNTTINQLVVFTALVLAVFLFRLYLRRHRMRQSRNQLPFVIGGWGTRGKSGTERKKAALFSSLGYNVVSKTTGSDATIIHSRPGLDPVELPIYRPGNKATIWEQEKICNWASRMNTQVFLWECMALGSDYADLMQHDWMKDDISTISNTFVDHENIQGPTGLDVTRSITSFVPFRSVLFTAEEHMYPLIHTRACAYETEIHPVSWYDSDLLADDVLDRFPYTVHPRNLALVLKMAEYLGIDTDLALKEIADNIIPDLGSFKKYLAEYRHRTLEFWNGMSANDQTSCMSNWRTGGFDTGETEQGQWVVTVVNNRDDRVARSHEFAEIIVNLTPANKHVLIGTNLSGLNGYIHFAARKFARTNAQLEEVLRGLDPRRQSSRVLEILDGHLESIRVDARSARILLAKIQRMLMHRIDDDRASKTLDQWIKAPSVTVPDIKRDLMEYLSDDLTPYTDELCSHIAQDIREYRQIGQFRDRIGQLGGKGGEQPGDIQRIEQMLEELLVSVIMNRILVIDDPHITGDQLIHKISMITPVGHHIKILGMQNIKGTGQDFAYRWISLGKVQSAVDHLKSADIETRRRAALWLADHDDYGLLDSQLGVQGLEAAQIDPANQDPDLRHVIDDANQKVSAVYRRRRELLRKSTRTGLTKWLAQMVEQILEVGDSKRRKRQVNRVMKDLFFGRISHGRAAKLLKEINKRQDGGWFLKR